MIDTDFLDFGFKIIRTIRNVERLDGYIRKAIIRRFWKRVVMSKALELQKMYDPQSSLRLLDYLNQYPVKGLINSIFNRERRKFTNLDLAVSLYITMKCHCNTDIQKELFIDITSSLTKSIIKAIEKNRIYKAEIRNLDKNLDRFNYRIHRELVFEILSNNQRLFAHHFKSFEEASFNNFITVWHPQDGESWVDWNSNQSLNIHMEPSRVMEGFFLLGFDYSHKNNSFLRKATRKDGFEYFDEDIENGEVIWLR